MFDSHRKYSHELRMSSKSPSKHPIVPPLRLPKSPERTGISISSRMEGNMASAKSPTSSDIARPKRSVSGSERRHI